MPKSKQRIGGKAKQAMRARVDMMATWAKCTTAVTALVAANLKKKEGTVKTSAPQTQRPNGNDGIINKGKFFFIEPVFLLTIPFSSDGNGIM